MNSLSAEQAAFAAALACATPAERAACLEAHCSGDDALRRRVDALLRAATQAGDFLEAPLAAPLPAGEISEQPGDRIGRYKLLEKIGEGGCGVVYMAEQEEPVRRRVALKIIKPGMDTRAVIARFEAERQALALMDHANIARVFDGGATPAGRPYFVMELVRGVPLTVYCDEAQLSTAERLRLFVLVCQAVQHAHQKGIIHRDLKPSNILVTVNDGVPVPKVIDFGIAKATGERLTDKSLFTQFHAFIGTPAYTSPEQAEMSSVDVDTRSDIYSLGVLLYELLTSRTPFDGEELLRSGLDEMRRIIRTEEPPRPSNALGRLDATAATALSAKRRVSVPELAGAVRGDLDWIVMKCLEKDRTRRYETASGLASDVLRHLEHEPVTARPPGRIYRFRKLVRRNKGAFFALAAILLVLCAGTAVSIHQALRARRGEAIANATLAELRDSAPAIAAQARAFAIEGKFSEAAEKFDYAIRLRPAETGYLLEKADLLDCQLRFSEAAGIWRAACALDPGCTAARTRLALSTQLAQEPPGTRAPQWHETLSRLYTEMTSGGENERHRSFNELYAIANLVSEHCREQLVERDAAMGKVLASRLRLDGGCLLTLDLKKTSITSLGVIHGLPLKTLFAESCAIDGLEPLRGMPLRHLNINYSKVVSLEPLRGMPWLRDLSIARTAVADLGPLHDLPALRWVEMAGVPATDLTPLQGTKIWVLRMADTKVENLAPLASLPLDELYATGIPARDFSPLAACSSLRHLEISGTALTDLTVFRHSRLSTLNISRTAVRDLSPLAGTSVQYLSFFDTAVTDLTPLLSCPALSSVGLARGAENVTALRALPKIQRISFTERNGGPAQTAAEFWKENPAP